MFIPLTVSYELIVSIIMLVSIDFNLFNLFNRGDNVFLHAKEKIKIANIILIQIKLKYLLIIKRIIKLDITIGILDAISIKNLLIESLIIDASFIL